MEQDKKLCPYCGEEIQAAAKKCRHCGEWLEAADKTTSNINSERHVENRHSELKKHKSIASNIAILLLLIANILVGFLWINDCLTPKSTKQYDDNKIAKIIKIGNPSNKIDSVSYALGCVCGENILQQQVEFYDQLSESDKNDIFAGIFRKLNTLDSEAQRFTTIQLGIQHSLNKEIESRSTVGPLVGDAIFQGVYDNAVSGRSSIMDPEEFGKVYHSSFK